MTARRPFLAAIVIGCTSLSGSLAHAEAKIQEFPDVVNSGEKGVDLAKTLAAAKVQALLASAPSLELRLGRIQGSLLGTHYHFDQFVNGTAVLNGEYIVSIRDDETTVYQTFENLPMAGATSGGTDAPLVGIERAYDAVWRRIGVIGDVTAKPEAKLYYKEYKGRLRLVYQVNLEVDRPYGAFVGLVDATDGKVLDLGSSRIERRKEPTPPLAPAAPGMLSNRKAAFARFASKNAGTDRPRLETERKDGHGLVFDPDPRTTLQNNSLEDSSDASAFEAAYFDRVLKDLSFDGRIYTLTGPWVSIIEFDAPTDAPSTSTTGFWNAKRGTNAFNDAMTYFHLDQSQRYIQDLGFSGTRGIQYGSIEVDTDGVNGNDNSYFQPTSNRLAFGHGCVDDNEDSDVILHEYGHALHNSINRNWNGGDTGAMGEGFGDYWAASYSVSTPNGRGFYPAQVFSWDGHGTSNACWPGRNLDALAARYDPTRTYSAHSPLSGGMVTDELWSTPLYQSLIALNAAGIPRREVDRVILESHFGLGSGIKMRQMATQIVKTAGLLYPNGPHKSVFSDKFSRHNILAIPHANLALGPVTWLNAGVNGNPDPGETVALNVAIANSGDLAASNVTASLETPTAGVSVSRAVGNYSGIAMGASASPLQPFELTIAKTVACGTPINLALKVNYSEDDSQTLELPFSVATGKPVSVLETRNPNVAIPDNNTLGVTSNLEIPATSTGVVSDSFKVKLELAHSYIGDVKVVLVSPKGTRVTLHDRTGDSAHNISGVYPTTLQPAEGLAKLKGEPLAGTWQLVVTDSASDDTGTLVSWGIEDTLRFECEQHSQD